MYEQGKRLEVMKERCKMSSRVVSIIQIFTIVGVVLSFVGMKTDLASGINGRVPEDTSLVLHLVRTVQKAPYSDFSDSVKGCRLGDAFLIFASAYHAITLLLLSVYCSVCVVYYI